MTRRGFLGGLAAVAFAPVTLTQRADPLERYRWTPDDAWLMRVFGRCDTCGAICARACHDLIRVPSSDGWEEMRSVGIVKRGCEAHPVESRVYESVADAWRDGPVDPWWFTSEAARLMERS